jgi:HEAT repeat protein
MWQPPPLPRTLEAALRDLSDRSPPVRVSAVHDLVPYLEGDRFRVLAALRQALRDEHPTPRAAAARVLGDQRVEECEEELLALVDDPDVLPAQVALDALGDLGTPAGIERLRAALTDSRPELRFQAVMALPRHAGDEEAERLLSAATHDPDPLVRDAALRTARERWQGRGQAPRVHRAARAALQDQDPGVRVAAALLLAAWGDDEGGDVLVQLLEGKIEPREMQDEVEAMEVAGELGLKEAIPALERRAYGLSRLLREQYAGLARISLARLGHRRAREGILRGLHGWLRSQREDAVIAAGQARLREALPRLEALMREPERIDTTLVRDALEAIRGAGS